MSRGVDAASNMAVERPAGPHPLGAAAHRQRSPQWLLGRQVVSTEL
jgi:hypothetical protein